MSQLPDHNTGDRYRRTRQRLFQSPWRFSLLTFLSAVTFLSLVLGIFSQVHGGLIGITVLFGSQAIVAAGIALQHALFRSSSATTGAVMGLAGFLLLIILVSVPLWSGATESFFRLMAWGGVAALCGAVICATVNHFSRRHSRRNAARR